MKKLSTTDEFIENLAGNVLRITDVDGGLLTGDLDSTSKSLLYSVSMRIHTKSAS